MFALLTPWWISPIGVGDRHRTEYYDSYAVLLVLAAESCMWHFERAMSTDDRTEPLLQ